MSIDVIGASAAPAPDSKDAQLRRAARDLEGVFVAELFKAMRETVPENSLFDGGAGEQMFTGMMDSHLAAQVPEGWNNGLGEALYRQLRAALTGGAEAAAATTDLTPAPTPTPLEPR